MPFSKYDVIMKVLEIVEQDAKIVRGDVTDASVSQITNIIARLEGNIVQEQTKKKEIVMEGDKFEDIHQSVIATRGSIAKGIIGVKEQHGDEIGNALQTLENALTGEPGEQLSDKQRQEALELLAEISQKGANADSPKSIIRSLGKTLWIVIEKVEPLSKACLAAWKVIEKLWA